jgi:hypothetical protein
VKAAHDQVVAWQSRGGRDRFQRAGTVAVRAKTAVAQPVAIIEMN